MNLKLSKFVAITIAVTAILMSSAANAGLIKLFAKTVVIGAGVTLGANAAADVYKHMTTPDKKSTRATCLAEAEFFKNNPAICKIAIEEGK